MQILEQVLHLKQTLLAFQTLLANKDWIGATEGLQHAARMHAAEKMPALRCLASLPEELSRCKAQLQVDVVQALQEAASFPAVLEVTHFAAGVLKVRL
jgi:hypothetical protein